MAEAENRRIGIMVGRAAVPRFQPRVGAELHHAEGNRGAGIRVPMLRRADHRPNALQRRRLAAETNQAAQMDRHDRKTAKTN